MTGSSMVSSRIRIIIPYFGKVVPWIRLFLRSCEMNPTYDFLIVTDVEIDRLPANVQVLKCPFADFVQRANKRLGTNIRWYTPYKICDLKPALGRIFEEFLEGYAFWGYSDIDLIWGDLGLIYDDEVMSYDVISSHTFLLSGHFALYRNIPELLDLFTIIPDWRAGFENFQHLHMDEIGMSDVIMKGQNRALLKFASQLKLHLNVNKRPVSFLFREQFTTFNQPWLLPSGHVGMPKKWVWDKGALSCDILPGRPMLYAHFSLWNSGHWGHGGQHAVRWMDRTDLIAPDLVDRPHYFIITENGFSAVPA